MSKNGKIPFLFICTFFSIAFVQSQNISGKVLGTNSEGENEPLFGANVYWYPSMTGVSTNENGDFTIEANNDTQLIISYIGYSSDTINQPTNGQEYVLKASTLQEFTVEAEEEMTKMSTRSATNVQTLNKAELLKAPCCNLSESFETNASIDASFTDAVTGTKQIKMLGLSGVYTQQMIENMPAIRGLAGIKGLSFVPGPWVNSIQVSKGVGSVVNGYESVTGQINVELLKNDNKEKMIANTYINGGGRLEGNLFYATPVSDKWSTGLMLHANGRFVELDQNNDNFMDFPIGQELNILNRWKYDGDNGWVGQVAANVVIENKKGGQIDSISEYPLYEIENQTELYKIWGKAGKVWDKPGASMGFQWSLSSYDQNSNYGFNQYTGHQNSGYFNWINQGIIGNTFHVYKAGLSIQYDQYSESYNNEGVFNVYNREEIVPGAFMEYTYNNDAKWNIVAGLRYDYHNLYGNMVTPRLHVRYATSDLSSIKLAAGKGYRTANIFAENPGMMASSRTVVITPSYNNGAYGLNQEEAWNFGLNFLQKFEIDYRPGSISIDLYSTQFENQVIVDWYQSAREVHFYNLDGSSYANTFQIEANYELVKRLNFRTAYRFTDAKAQYDSGIETLPYVPQHRGFINLGFETRKKVDLSKWQFDITANYIGEQQLPGTSENSPMNQRPDVTEAFVMMSAQVAYNLKDKWRFYVGGENLTSYTQENPIVSADNPYSGEFDASMIYAPIFGRMFYAGVTFQMK